MEDLICFTGVSKRYRGKTVLDQIDLTIKKGQSISFTGHNGCGKSTMLKLAAHLICPTKGTITHTKKLLICYVPEHFPKSNLSMQEYLLSMAELDGYPKTEAVMRYQSLVEDFFMTSMLDIPLKHLSKGSLQKVGVIQALLTVPDVLLLDEPLSGQDADSQKVFIQKINELRKSGMTVLMSCHEPYLMEAISDMIYQIENGKLVQVELNDQKEYSDTQIELLFSGNEEKEIPLIWSNIAKREDTICQMDVTEAQADEVILSMLQNGWSLKKMKETSVKGGGAQ